MSRNIKLYLRVNAEERAALESAAETEGVSVSEYIRRILFLGMAAGRLAAPAQSRREVNP